MVKMNMKRTKIINSHKIVYLGSCYGWFIGEQLVNHIPNCNLLTNKLGLLNSLQEYSRVCANVQKKAMKLDFIPETYRLDDPKDKELFMDTYKGQRIQDFLEFQFLSQLFSFFILEFLHKLTYGALPAVYYHHLYTSALIFNWNEVK